MQPHMESGHILFQTWRAFPRLSFFAGPLPDRIREVLLFTRCLISAGLQPPSPRLSNLDSRVGAKARALLCPRRSGLRIVRFRINAKAHLLRRCCSSHEIIRFHGNPVRYDPRAQRQVMLYPVCRAYDCQPGSRAALRQCFSRSSEGDL